MTRLVIRDRTELRRLLRELCFTPASVHGWARSFESFVAADFSALVETAPSGEQGCEDSRRLDWLSACADSESGIWGIERQALEGGRTLREAIDAARSTQNIDTPESQKIAAPTEE